MIRRHELTDAEWALLEPLMPPHPVQGHRWNDHRRTINGILWRIRTGTPWRDLPERYGNWKSVYDRHRRWSRDGTWQQIAEALRVDADTDEPLDTTVGIDSSSVRAHQHAGWSTPSVSGRAESKGGSLTRVDPDRPEALGRVRGG